MSRNEGDIVCLGWGSLIWSPEPLPVVGEWQRDGPSLPIEFARELKDGRVTLVIAPGAKRSCVLWSRLCVSDVDCAKILLARREGIEPERIKRSIGHWPDGQSDDQIQQIVADWAKAREHPPLAVIWTALKPGMKAARKLGNCEKPTREQVVAHLQTLSGCERQRAEQYVRLTPKQI